MMLKHVVCSMYHVTAITIPCSNDVYVQRHRADRELDVYGAYHYARAVVGYYPSSIPVRNCAQRCLMVYV